MSTATAEKSAGSGNLSSGFRQHLGLFDSIMLVVGTMIGSGIFIVSADMARDVGSSGWLIAAWVLTALMTIMGALSYAELAAMMPHAGGQYIFLREAYSPLWGFLYGWACFLVIQTGSIAAVGVAFAKFLGVFVPALGTGDEAIIKSWKVDWNISARLPWMDEPITFFKRDEFAISNGQLVAAGIVMLLSLLNCRGIREGKWVQNLFTVAKVAAMVLLIVLGLTLAVKPAAITANVSDWWSGIHQSGQYQEVAKLAPGSGMLIALMVMGGAMVGSLFAADAWNNITFTAGEIRNPRRNLPLSLALGVGTVMVLYLLANTAYMVALPVTGDSALAEQLDKEAKAVRTPEERRAVEEKYKEATFQLGISQAHNDRVGTAVLQEASPKFGVPFMALAIMISSFGCVNGMILMGARLYYAMAQDGLFFQSVGRLNGRGVPAAGLILQGIWSVLLIFSGTYSELLDYVIFAVLVFYVLTVIGLFILRRTQPDLERPYRAFGYPFVPALYVFLCAVICIDLLIVKPVYTWPGLILVLTGIPVYFIWRGMSPPSAASVRDVA
jgi:APA family basic amino acid/polyamine antiporter